MAKTTLKLTQRPYIDSIGSDPYYTALAIDIQGNDYTVIWDIIIDDPDSWDDNSNMCDWDSPSEIFDKNGKELDVINYQLDNDPINKETKI